MDQHQADCSVLVPRMYSGGIDDPCHSHRADDRAPSIAEGLLGGAGPDGGAIEPAHEFDPPSHRLPVEHLIVVGSVLVGQMRWREVVIGTSKNFCGPLNGVVQQKPPIDPGVPALPVLDPALHALDLVEESGDASGHWIERSQLRRYFHCWVSSWSDAATDYRTLADCCTPF